MPAQRTPGGGAKQRGGGKTSWGDPPHGKQVPTPLTSVRPPPCHFSYEFPYELSGEPPKNSFRRVSNNCFQGATLARFFPPAVFPPPPPLWLGQIRDRISKMFLYLKKIGQILSTNYFLNRDKLHPAPRKRGSYRNGAPT